MNIVGHSSRSLGSNTGPSENGKVVASSTADPDVRSQAEHQRMHTHTHTHTHTQWQAQCKSNLNSTGNLVRRFQNSVSVK
jgi:hypothetical protein